MTEEEIQRVAEEVKEYLAIHLCQIQADPMNSELLLEFKRIYTNLTLMEEDKGTKQRTPLLYDNLLRTTVNGRFPKRLLVEGEGGVGKTTFCAKIAWDWIHGNGYLDFKLVLVILLRKAENKTVGEIVKSYLSDNNPVTAKQLDKHILSNPKDVFLVLDGLDELAVDLYSNQQIIMITLNKLFKSGKVLITSRQWKSDDIRKNAVLRKVFAFIAVEGFSAENLSSYITKFFHPDTTSSEDLNRFISNNDVIRENMAPYPLYTAMLCIMWKEFNGERREAMSKLQTFSQLFNEMIDFLVDHYLSKHIPSGIDEGKLRENRSHIRCHLLQIGLIAFQGLLGRRLVFREEEFQSYPGSIDVGCNVGVLTREKQIIPRRDRRDNPNSEAQSVQFPHKLFQEYLSGMYLASLYNSNRNEYDKLMANIIREAVEYRYLLYITSAQQKEVGLDIVSRLIASKTGHQPFGGDDDDCFIVDVAYESQDQAVAKAVADHVSTESRKTLKITKEMQAHTVSGHIFIMNHIEVDDLIIERPCGRTNSEDLAEFMCSSRSLKSVTIASSMHDVFYSVLAKKAVDSKIETLVIGFINIRQRPSASRDLARFICKMHHLKNLKLGGQYHDDFYSTLSSMAPSAKVFIWDLFNCIAVDSTTSDAQGDGQLQMPWELCEIRLDDQWASCNDDADDGDDGDDDDGEDSGDDGYKDEDDDDGRKMVLLMKVMRRSINGCDDGHEDNVNDVVMTVTRLTALFSTAKRMTVSDDEDDDQHIDECASNPCVNEGVCNNLVDRFTCDCVGGYDGITCDADIDECYPDTCLNGGECNNFPGSFTCDCAAGYEGITCETDIDECASGPCMANEDCTDGMNMYTCACSPGYAGTPCEDIDECASGPCMANEDCTDGINMYTCACSPGYAGTPCEDIDECASGPCMAEENRA
eukprot:XP_011661877.1 PREDICTED: uncharacterized protein LOC105437225 [Strongylocentrotus purpuratus]